MPKHLLGGFVDVAKPNPQLGVYRDWRRNNILPINGKLVRVNKRPRPNDTCEVCGITTPKLDYHHWDDSRPELGVWVCKKCHNIAEGVDNGLALNYLELKRSISNM
mgnify:CR=1 FL=1